jgi:SET domain-containing protein
MMHPATELRLVSPEVGYGVFALDWIPRGTLTWVLDELDQRIAPERVKALEADYGELLRRYAYTQEDGLLVLAWDHGRFINHSCSANCLSGGAEEFEIAVRDISPGEQLTDDYSEFSLFEPFSCRCGALACRQRVRPDPEGAELRKRQVESALALASTVSQPLAAQARPFGHLDRALADGAAVTAPR